MKKGLFLIALAGLALASCVKNEVAENRGQNLRVGFESPVLYSSADTKANVHGELAPSYTYQGSVGQYTYPREENFKIFAVQHVGNLTSWADAQECEFNGQDISYIQELDAWAPLKNDGGYYYWPDGKLLSFSAMSPADLELPNVTTTYDAQGLKIENYVVNDDPAEQLDVLYAERKIDQSADKMVDGADFYSGIGILFKHAMSSIHFSIKKDGVSEEVTLNKIILKNAVNKGTFNENITNETAYASEPAWTASTNAQDKAEYLSFQGNVSFPLTAQYVSSIASKEDTSHSLLLMPQHLTDDMTVEITYTVGDETKTKTIKLNEYPKASGVNPITEWEVGKRYTYRLVYSKSSEIQDIIYFAPGVDGWTSLDPIEVIL